MAQFDAISDHLSCFANFGTYRETERTASLPFIPFFGLVMKDVRTVLCVCVCGGEDVAELRLTWCDMCS